MLIDKEVKLTSLSPLALAFIGDTVFDILIRSELVCEANRPVKELHKEAASKVCAAAQARYIKKVLPLLSEDEEEIFKRGRNAHTGTVPKNQSSADYHYATGLECLFGWLYLSGKNERIKELYELMKEEKNDEDN